jgi:hypothetical protein
MDVRDLARLADDMSAALDRFLAEGENVALMSRGFEELTEARRRFKEALVECWPQLEACKHLPGYADIIRRSEKC